MFKWLIPSCNKITVAPPTPRGVTGCSQFFAKCFTPFVSMPYVQPYAVHSYTIHMHHQNGSFNMYTIASFDIKHQGALVKRVEWFFLWWNLVSDLENMLCKFLTLNFIIIIYIEYAKESYPVETLTSELNSSIFLYLLLQKEDAFLTLNT